MDLNGPLLCILPEESVMNSRQEAALGLPGLLLQAPHGFAFMACLGLKCSLSLVLSTWPEKIF